MLKSHSSNGGPSHKHLSFFTHSKAGLVHGSAGKETMYTYKKKNTCSSTVEECTLNWKWFNTKTIRWGWQFQTNETHNVHTIHLNNALRKWRTRCLSCYLRDFYSKTRTAIAFKTYNHKLQPKCTIAFKISLSVFIDTSDLMVSWISIQRCKDWKQHKVF